MQIVHLLHIYCGAVLQDDYTLNIFQVWKATLLPSYLCKYLQWQICLNSFALRYMIINKCLIISSYSIKQSENISKCLSARWKEALYSNFQIQNYAKFPIFLSEISYLLSKLILHCSKMIFTSIVIFLS